ncbi:D-sedoheptulose 7-phosphate isomerase [Candidatus Woesearchaeota archaeon]|nr:D-sedoheptulose 7-phosphate isomerase [Candidatus Woesearchaeota archaeon]
MKETITQIFDDSIKTKEVVKKELLDVIEDSVKLIIDALKNGNKVLVCGNGGSAADAQHFVAELVVRFEKDRKSLPAIALTTDTSLITACANDYGYDELFSRQVEGLGNTDDVLVGISTSGNSLNVIKAFQTAKEKNMLTICLNGKDGGKIKSLELDSDIVVPGTNTGRIQESHITIIHAWCKLIEEELFKEK